LAELDFSGHVLHRTDNVADEARLLLRIHHAEEVPGLRVVLVPHVVVVAVGVA
jgi:hypothetical protein